MIVWEFFFYTSKQPKTKMNEKIMQNIERRKIQNAQYENCKT